MSTRLLVAFYTVSVLAFAGQWLALLYYAVDGLRRS